MLVAFFVSGCSEEVGNVSLGLFTTKDVKIQAFTDSEVSGVTCHISHIEANLDFADPSDMGIACRQTGPIDADMIRGLNDSSNGDQVFRTSKSILFKNLKVRRILDKKNKTLIYLSYSTKETEGSDKHSISTVPLWGTAAYSELGPEFWLEK